MIYTIARGNWSGLINKTFRRIWFGESASILGAEMMAFAVPVFMTVGMNLSPFEIAAVTAAGSSAPLLVSLSTGAIADKFDRRRILILSSIIRAIIVLAFPFMYWLGILNSWVLGVCLFLVMAITMLFDAALTATLPHVVSKSQLMRANSWMEAGRGVAATGAPIIAGSLIPVIGVPWVAVVNSVTYFISAFTVSSTPKGPRQALSEDALDVTHWQDIKEGIRLALGHHVLRPMILTAATFNFFQSWLFAVFIVYAVRVLGVGPVAIGVIFSAVGIVGLVAAILAPVIVEKRTPGSAVIWAFVLIGISAIFAPLLDSMGGNPAAVGFTVVFAVWEFCVVIAVIVGDTARQTLIEDRFQSRAASVERFATWGLDPVGALIGGAVASTTIGLSGSLIIAAFGMAIPAVIAVSSSGIRQLKMLPTDSE